MNNEERIRLGLEITGQEGLEDSARKVDQLKKSYNDLLLAEMDRGDAEQRLRTRKADIERQEATASDAAVAQLVENTRVRRFYNEVLDESVAKTETVIVSARQMGQTLSNDGAGGRGILQASYAVQDFTSVLSGGGGLARAIGAVQNNIPLLLTSLGVGAGLAGTISLVSVAVAAAIPLISSFADKEKEAADATKKWADESERLKAQQTSGEDEKAKGVGAYLKDLPARTVEQGIRTELIDRARRQGLGFEQDQLRQFGVVTENADAFVERNMPAITADTNRLFAGLATDPSARQFVASLAAARPGNFPRNFGTDILSFDRDTGDADLADAEAFGARAHAGVEARQKARAETEARRKRVEAKQAAEDASIRQQADLDDQSTAEADRLAAQMHAESIRIENEQRREQAAAAAKSKHAADQAARDAQPDAVLRRQQEAEYRQAAAETMRQNRQQGLGMSADQMQAVARQAVGSLPGSSNDMVSAVQYSIRLLDAKIREERRREAERLRVWSESSLSN